MTPRPRAKRAGKDWKIFRALKRKSAIAFIGWQECVQEQRAFARFLFLSAHPGAAKDDIMKKLQSMLAESRQCGDMGPMMILGKLCDCGMRECYIRKGSRSRRWCICCLAA